MVRESSDKYAVIVYVLLQHWNKKSNTLMLTVLEGDNFGTSDMRRSFEGKIHQDWTIISWRNEFGDWIQ